MLLAGFYYASIAIDRSGNGGLAIVRTKSATIGVMLIFAAFGFWLILFTNYPKLPLL